jgi:diphthamide biosynthesis methyltransferase
VRLNEGINDALRTLLRYRGDLSKMALQALETIDVARVALVSPDEPMVADTTISMPRTLHKRLKKIAEERRTSMNIVVNTALAHWLAGKGALRLAQ